MIWFWFFASVVLGTGAFFCARKALELSTRLRLLEASKNSAAEEFKARHQFAEAQLARMSQEYETLMASCGAGVIVLSRDGIIERVNPPARRILGVSTSGLVGKSLLQATLSRDLSALLAESHHEQIAVHAEVRMPGSSGNCVLVTVAPMGNKGEEPWRFVLVAHDVTELRRLETIRRDFVANVSHELRTPLASIRAMAETLQDGALDDHEVAMHFVETIITEAQRLTRISEDLLILSRAESRAPEKAMVSLSLLMEEIVSRFRQQAEKAGLILLQEIPPHLSVFANGDQIEQVLVNLIDNAIKYTASGGSICVTADRLPAGVAVHVADTGIGLMSQDVPRVFERFYRVDKARSRQSGGTGLGLSIVKHIVEAHGGQVTVESEYNRGSTFTFTLPMGEDSSEKAIAPAEMAAIQRSW